MLEKIIFRQMDEPAKKAAFKNDEIDAAAAGTASAYSEFKAVAGTELHKGVRLHVSGIDVNPPAGQGCRRAEGYFLRA